MTATVDLKELSVRESERVEWKENVASISDVVETIVAFANDISNLGGGYVVCGAKEGKDEAGFQKVFHIGLTANRLKEIEGAVLSECREKVSPAIIPITEEIPITDSEKRILVFLVPATGQAHNYRSSGKDASTYYIRVGRETREARNSLLRELLLKKRVVEPWDRRINYSSTIDDIDLLVLRDYLQQMRLWDINKPLEDYISDKERLSSFTSPLAGRENLTNVIRPRNFTLLLFGKDLTKLFPGAYSIFSIYRGKDRSEPTAERIEVIGTVVEQAKKLIELLNAESYIAFDKTHPRPNQVKYPIRALSEAVVNALVHRDYESDQPVRVTVFSDRIEINSAGSLPRAVDPEKFKLGKASPYWRNQTLAYFFNKLQLAQGEGQGIPTIIRTMLAEGCPSPIFEIGEENLLCILPAHPRHELVRELTNIENMIILGNYQEALLKLEALLKNDPYNFRSLELFCEVNNLLKSPQRVYDFMVSHKLDFSKINSGTLIVIAETIISLQNHPEAIKIANVLMSKAVAGRLEESEIKRIAIGYRKLKDNEKAVAFIDDAMIKTPTLAGSAALLELRAKSKIDLAKKCMDTAKNPDTSHKMKGRAWEQCRAYLDNAEKDLNRALETVTNEIEKDYILRDLDFLKNMQQIVQRPKPKSSHRPYRKYDKYSSGRR